VDLEEKSDKGKNKVEPSPSTSQVQLEHQLERSTISCEYESQPPSKTDDEDGDFKDASSCSPPSSSSANHTAPLPDTNSSTRRSTRSGTINSTIESQKKAQEEQQLNGMNI
jgi:hypothetical protein